MEGYIQTGVVAMLDKKGNISEKDRIMELETETLEGCEERFCQSIGKLLAEQLHKYLQQHGEEGLKEIRRIAEKSKVGGGK